MAHSSPSFTTSADKSSLHLQAETTQTRDDKHQLLFDFLKSHPGSTLVYVTLQKVSGGSPSIPNRLELS